MKTADMKDTHERIRAFDANVTNPTPVETELRDIIRKVEKERDAFYRLAGGYANRLRHLEGAAECLAQDIGMLLGIAVVFRDSDHKSDDVATAKIILGELLEAYKVDPSKVSGNARPH